MAGHPDGEDGTVEMGARMPGVQEVGRGSQALRMDQEGCPGRDQGWMVAPGPALSAMGRNVGWSHAFQVLCHTAHPE